VYARDGCDARDSSGHRRNGLEVWLPMLSLLIYHSLLATGAVMNA